MVFSSSIFLICFLPICLLVYEVVPKVLGKRTDRRTVQNIILLIFSILFYSLGGVKYLALMVLIILINYAGGFLCCKGRHSDAARTVFLVLIIQINLLILLFFKYSNFVVSIIENVFFNEERKLVALQNILMAKGNGHLGFPEIVLPIGISFYTFQALSYVIDVYRDKVKLQSNPFYFALYISFFPQLIAGPIVQYKDIEDQIINREENVNKVAAGIKRFCYGFAKKVIIANTMAEIVDSVWALDFENMGALLAWFGAICYSFQIYYDFSGYSDMAIGLAGMFGFELKENFNYPYQAESIKEFWRRWHISLSSWFRDYVYIPLGGSRNGTAKTYRNLFLVFLLTGIWHGANWTFVVWGVSYGILLILERAFLGEKLEKIKWKSIRRILVFVVVTILWVVFRADNILDAGAFISRMFIGGKGEYNIFTYLSAKSFICFIFAVLCGGILQKININKRNLIYRFFSYAFAIVLLLVGMFMLVNGTYNPFIYFQF